MSDIAERIGIGILGLTLAGVAIAYEQSPSFEPVPYNGFAAHDRLHFPPLAVDLREATLRDNAAEVARLVELDPSLIRFTFGGKGTVLHAAAFRGAEQSMRVLIERGAELDVLGAEGETPLHLAAMMGHSRSVEVLLSSGAEVEIRCRQYQGTPLMWAAAASGQERMRNTRPWVEVVRMLVEAGAKADTRDRNDRTAESIASPDVAEYLRERIKEERRLMAMRM
jgi:hypothetical protein